MIVVNFPSYHPCKNMPLTLMLTGEFLSYIDLPNGEYFTLNGCVFQKMDNQNAGQLFPWVDEYFEMDSNRLCRVMVERLAPETKTK